MRPFALNFPDGLCLPPERAILRVPVKDRRLTDGGSVSCRRRLPGLKANANKSQITASLSQPRSGTCFSWEGGGGATLSESAKFQCLLQ